MAAEPPPAAPLTRRPLLLGQVEGSAEAVAAAALVPKEEGLISVSEDRTLLKKIMAEAYQNKKVSTSPTEGKQEPPIEENSTFGNSQ